MTDVMVFSLFYVCGDKRSKGKEELIVALCYVL